MYSYSSYKNIVNIVSPTVFSHNWQEYVNFQCILNNKAGCYALEWKLGKHFCKSNTGWTPGSIEFYDPCDTRVVPQFILKPKWNKVSGKATGCRDIQDFSEGGDFCKGGDYSLHLVTKIINVSWDLPSNGEVGAVVRFLPPNPEVPGLIPGLVKGWIFVWPPFPLKSTHIPGLVKWVPAYMDHFEAAARCTSIYASSLLGVKHLWASLHVYGKDAIDINAPLYFTIIFLMY